VRSPVKRRPKRETLRGSEKERGERDPRNCFTRGDSRDVFAHASVCIYSDWRIVGKIREKQRERERERKEDERSDDEEVELCACVYVWGLLTLNVLARGLGVIIPWER